MTMLLPEDLRNLTAGGGGDSGGGVYDYQGGG